MTSNTDYTLDEIEVSCEEGRSCVENGDCGEGQCDELGGFCECSKSTIYDYETSFMDRSGFLKSLEKDEIGRKSSKEGKRLHIIPLKGARSLIGGFRSGKGHSRRDENHKKNQAMKENMKHFDKGKNFLTPKED